MASSLNHTVKLPRLTSATSYSGQFVIRYLTLGILWRRLSLNLYGMDLTCVGRPQTAPPRRRRCQRRRLLPSAAVAQPLVYSSTKASGRHSPVVRFSDRAGDPQG